jgi:Caspase domain
MNARAKAASMSVRLCVLVAAFATARPSEARLAADPEITGDVKRFALVVGANRGDDHEIPLRFAESDAERIRETLASVGDFPPDQVMLLRGVTAAEMRNAVIRVNARLRQEEGDTLLFVYFSGHADAESLHLVGTRLTLHELRSLMIGSPATSRVLVLDACRSGALTRIKGGAPADSFDVRMLELPLPRGTAFITSSTATEDSQESDWLRGSFFTHYFNAGLLGAADKDQDGRVTLAESFGFAAAETNVATARTRGGPQNPTYRFDLGGRQDLVLSRPRLVRRNLGIVQLMQPGRYIVQRLDPSGVLHPVADVTASRANTQVTLPPGRYQIGLRAPDMYLEAPREVPPGGAVSVSASDMRRLDYARVVRKGLASAPVHSVALAGGARSGYLGLGAAPEAMLSLRQDRAQASLEARLGAGGVWHDNGLGTDIEHYTGSASLLVSRTLDFSWLSVSGGAEAGVIFVRQVVNENSHVSQARQQSTLGTSMGAFAAPVLQLELPLRARAYVRFEASLPISLVKSGNWPPEAKRRWLIYRRGIVGLGVYL